MMPKELKQTIAKRSKKSKLLCRNRQKNLFQAAIEAYESGDFSVAIQYCRSVLEQQPNCVDAWFFLGNLEREQNNIDGAIAAYQKLTILQPKNSTVFGNLGVLYIQQKQLENGIDCLTQAIELNPNCVDAYNNLGQLHYDLGKYELAESYLKQAIALQPDFFIAIYNLGNVYKGQDRLSEAIACYQQVLQLQPQHSNTYNNLGNTYLSAGEPDLAIQAYQQGIKFDPNSLSCQDNLLFSLHYNDQYSPQQISTQHQDWGKKFQSLFSEYTNHQNSVQPQRQLKIGYISGDLKTHSVSYFFEPLLANGDRSNVLVFCYANNRQADGVTRRLQQLADGWREIHHLSDRSVAELIVQDEIDILVDLSGHTFGNRLGIFAYKPAPIQISYLGYPNTTGLTTIDYRLTDAYADPPGITEHLYSEKLVRMPHFMCYQPPSNTPEIKALPAIANGYITFGSFNNLAKITPQTLDCWIEILQQVPNSRLFLKARSLQDSATCDRLYQTFQDAGISRDRLQLLSWTASSQEHLNSYNRVDIALDTFPYHGTTTTCEAMWMGVPVVSLAGNTHVSRVGVSLLSSVGLTEFIATSTEDYCHKAVALAKDIPKLAQIRQNLRSQIESSPLTGGKAFVRFLESIYRQMWQQWCDRQTPTPAKILRRVTIPAKPTSDRKRAISQSCPSKSDKQNTNEVICTIHHLSATGGTLISKCLAAMPNTILLSEINPGVTLKGFNPFDPIQQLAQHGLLDTAELEDIFLERIALILRKCQQQQLIIRDHAHSDFLLANSIGKARLRKTLQKQYTLKSILTVRNPIDSWLAMIPQGWHRQVKTFDRYCDRYLQLLDTYQDASIYLYEDFVQQPDVILQKMCRDYGIKFDRNYQQKLADLKLSGDSGRTSTTIAPRPRRKCPPKFVKEVKKSSNFKKICQRLGYSRIS